MINHQSFVNKNKKKSNIDFKPKTNHKNKLYKNKNGRKIKENLDNQLLSFIHLSEISLIANNPSGFELSIPDLKNPIIATANNTSGKIVIIKLN